ncbi:hypothetical protein B0J11DRAFT_585658 [Dendryphion nanum]|uniref:Uncharacterized protein n=1 Tax=Dendryphion nanum TaxID=256645 RepID=A0A9P9D2C2_9PLEO|nr:hypothetical protein B0J11DRAFT_585658 [Dendryphion nanum]
MRASLFVKAKLLAQSLFGTGRFPLPASLEPHRAIIHTLFFGASAAAGAGLYHYVREYHDNQAKIQLAIFHVIRLIDTRSDEELHYLLRHPHELIRDLCNEVRPLLATHLTEIEGEAVKKELRHMVWRREIGPVRLRPVRRKHGRFEPREGSVEAELEEELNKLRQPNKRARKDDSEEDVSADEDPVARSSKEETSEEDSPEGDGEEDVHVSLMDVDSPSYYVAQPSYTYRPQPVLPSPPPTSENPGPGFTTPLSGESSQNEGFGFDYEDWSSSSAFDEEVTSMSRKGQCIGGQDVPVGQTHTPSAHDWMANPTNPIDMGVAAAFDPNLPSNRLAFFRVKHNVPQPPKVHKKPEEYSPHTPESFYSIWKGPTRVKTNLSPIVEGSSTPNSTKKGTQYRVAESQRFYQSIKNTKPWVLIAPKTKKAQEAVTMPKKSPHGVDKAIEGDGVRIKQSPTSAEEYFLSGSAIEQMDPVAESSSPSTVRRRATATWKKSKSRQRSESVGSTKSTRASAKQNRRKPFESVVSTSEQNVGSDASVGSWRSTRSDRFTGSYKV